MTIPLHITTLLFDLDGTLIHQQPSSLDILLTIMDEHQVPLITSAHRATQQFMFRYWANSEELAADLDMYGDFTDAFYFQYLKRKLWAAGLTDLQAADLAPRIQAAFEERYQPATIVLDDVRPTLKSLRRLGYKMGLVSNRSSSIDAEIQELGFESYLDFYFSSSEVDCWKPDPAIFEHALYLAESTPDVTAYIGDNYYTDIVGAQNSGIYPILFDPRNIFPDADCQVITKISSLVSQM
ncbi:MAG: HAD family hydrolase [Anaerolineales bacterium]|nr:MAG: HAD family hydrolase [Anaerolineales bacterium]